MLGEFDRNQGFTKILNMILQSHTFGLLGVSNIFYQWEFHDPKIEEG